MDHRDVPERTTLTLDDDVAARLRAKARATAQPFKAVVNDTLRAGLDAHDVEPVAPFAVKARPLHLKPGIELDSIADLLDLVEGPEHR